VILRGFISPASVKTGVHVAVLGILQDEDHKKRAAVDNTESMAGVLDSGL